MPIQTRNVYHKRGRTLRGGVKEYDTPIILRNSKKSVSNEPLVGPDRPVQTLRKIIDMVQKIKSKVTELLIAIIHCLNQLPFCALQPGDCQTKV